MHTVILQPFPFTRWSISSFPFFSLQNYRLTDVLPCFLPLLVFSSTNHFSLRPGPVSRHREPVCHLRPLLKRTRIIYFSSQCITLIERLKRLSRRRFQFFVFNAAVNRTQNPQLHSIKVSRKMDSVKHSAGNPSKSRLLRAVSKVLHIHPGTGKVPDDGIHRMKKSREKTKKDQFKHANVPAFDNKDEELQDRIVKEAFLSKLFAEISAIKAAYAEMQFAQSPYDADGIQSADKIVISELKSISELKQCFFKDQLTDMSPGTSLLFSEIQEQKSTLKMYEVTTKKLDSLLKLKDSEIIFLKEKLAEANKGNKSLEKRLNLSGQFVIPDDIQLPEMRPVHFISYYRQALKSIRSFVQLLITEMESAEWDLDAAANSIEPGTSFRKPSHKCFAFESFVCKQMFDGFNCPEFSAQKPMPERDKRCRLFFDRFRELKPVKLADYLAQKPKSSFTRFCRSKYLRLVHPKMESSLFGCMNQRNSVASGDLPETPFFLAFSEMAKRVWLLHCLALSFDPEISIFQVSKGSRFSEVYMESLGNDVLLLSEANPETDPLVAFSIVPGFRVGKTVLQCQVYLC